MDKIGNYMNTVPMEGPLIFVICNKKGFQLDQKFNVFSFLVNIFNDLPLINIIQDLILGLIL